MRAITICCAAFLSACSTQQANDSPASGLEPATFTVHCQKSWADCYSNARKVCGHGDFDEVDRHATSAIVNTGRPATPTSVHSEQADIDLMDRTVTIRCN